jgi:hypothetical protein
MARQTTPAELEAILSALCSRMDAELPDDVGFILVLAREASEETDEGFAIQSNIRAPGCIELMGIVASHMAEAEPHQKPKHEESN